MNIINEVYSDIEDKINVRLNEVNRQVSDQAERIVVGYKIDNMHGQISRNIRGQVLSSIYLQIKSDLLLKRTLK